MRIIVLRLPDWSRNLLARFPRWKETSVPMGARILKHAHAFLAVYFTFGIGFLETDAERRPLPPAAIVFVPPRVVHGWIGSDNNGVGTVGHFHQGHPAHVIEPLAAGAA